MPPTINHERYSTIINDFVREFCMFFDIELESAGSTTFQSEKFDKGVEPAGCFYLQNVGSVRGKINLKKPYPTPDIAVEIDITTESLDKFPIYAALEVPELWVYDGKDLAFYELDGENYHQTSHSRALAKISAIDLAKFLEIGKKQGQTAALKSFRRSLQG